MDITIVMAAKNEAVSLEKARPTFGKLCRDNNYRLIVVDDGSVDNTEEVLKRYHDDGVNIDIIRYYFSQGKSKAICVGFHFTSKEDPPHTDIFVEMDADFQQDPAEIPLLIKEFDKGYDMVLGWRHNRFEGDSNMKKRQSDIFNAILRTLTGSKLHDHNCPFKAFKKEILDTILPYPTEDGYHRYMTPRALKKGYTVGEVKITWSKRASGKSSYSGISRIIQGTTHLIKLKLTGKI